jgi:hypothetical protein
MIGFILISVSFFFFFCAIFFIIRPLDKSDDFERKAQEYMLKTQAYEEITNGRCPLADNLCAVQTLLDSFINKNVLTKKQRDQLSPKLNKLELGHYHGLPKPHKVSVFSRLVSSL